MHKPRRTSVHDALTLTQVWVENMNSVMDDNKLLTLPNGERIRLAPHVKLLFEVADLQYASPATISRWGCILRGSILLAGQKGTQFGVGSGDAVLRDDSRIFERRLAHCRTIAVAVLLLAYITSRQGSRSATRVQPCQGRSAHVQLSPAQGTALTASPLYAPAPRCGMVFVDSRNLGWRPYLWRWLNGRTAPGEADALRPLFDKYAGPGIDWVIEGLDGGDVVKRPQQSVPLTGLNLLAQLCGLLEALLAPAAAGGEGEAAAAENSRLQDPQVGFLWGFLFCGMPGLQCSAGRAARA